MTERQKENEKKLAVYLSKKEEELKTKNKPKK
jgi:hypothetical protein